MKIHNFVRDAKQMELAELQAVNERVRAVQAITQPNEPENESATETEAPKETARKTTRSKKAKEGV